MLPSGESEEEEFDTYTLMTKAIYDWRQNDEVGEKLVADLPGYLVEVVFTAYAEIRYTSYFNY